MAQVWRGRDRLANFRRCARLLGARPRQTWAIYFITHVDALMTWARTGAVESESLRGRFIDAACYAVLGAALAEEEKARARGGDLENALATSDALGQGFEFDAEHLAQCVRALAGAFRRLRHEPVDAQHASGEAGLGD